MHLFHCCLQSRWRCRRPKKNGGKLFQEIHDGLFESCSPSSLPMRYVWYTILPITVDTEGFCQQWYSKDKPVDVNVQMTQRIVQIRPQLLGVSSPQELVRDLQHTHKTETTITQHNSWFGSYTEGVFYRVNLQHTVSLLYCGDIFLTCDFPAVDWMVPGPSSPPPLSPSILPSLSSALPLLALPLCPCIGTLKTATHSEEVSHQRFYAPSIWVIGELLLVHRRYRRSILSSCSCRDTFSSRTILNCSLRLDYGRVLLERVRI